MQTKLVIHISRTYGISRRKAAELIKNEYIRVNNEIIKDLTFQVEISRDRIECSSIELKSNQKEKTILIFNKPKGFVVSKNPSDKERFPSVYKLIPEEFRTTFNPVGRLDADSEGLLLFTNDGEMNFKLTHPSYEIPRTYLIWLNRKIPMHIIHRIRSEGVVLEDGICKPSLIETGRTSRDAIKIILTGGRKREIRRLFWTFYLTVERLLRISYGPFRLGNMKKGEIRFPETIEMNGLRKIFQLKLD
ncbi:MAG: rRNA pseudouridine synthase [Candidatus Coatesbacteria bacterium]|nr:rRNA pseudouridine synthase [Candidatus Coatesbacteria bacterium]